MLQSFATHVLYHSLNALHISVSFLSVVCSCAGTHVALAVDGAKITIAIDGDRQWSNYQVGYPTETTNDDMCVQWDSGYDDGSARPMQAPVGNMPGAQWCTAQTEEYSNYPPWCATSVDDNQKFVGWAYCARDYAGTGKVNVLWDESTGALVDGSRDFTFHGLTAFTAFTFSGEPAHFGAKAGGQQYFFKGAVAGVAIFSRHLAVMEFRCLYSWGETALRVPPISNEAPITELMGSIVDGCLGGNYVENPVCEKARQGLSACAGLGSDDEYCANAECAAAIGEIESKWETCRDDPALAPLWGDLAGICQESCEAGAWAGVTPEWSEALYSREGCPVAGCPAPGGWVMSGDAFLDGALGLALDGDGDYATINNVGNYADDADFSLGMWFSRSSECRDDADWEFLWSHQQDWEARLTNSTNVHVAALCGARHETLGEGSTVITTIIMDDNRNFVQFDWSIGREAPKLNAVTSEWTHMVLSVTPGGITVYVDGHAVREYGYHVWSEEWSIEKNLANPTVTTLKATEGNPSGKLSPFTFGDSPVVLGSFHSAGWSSSQFRGNIAGLSLHSSVNAHVAKCWFQAGTDAATGVGVCPAPDEGEYGDPCCSISSCFLPLFRGLKSSPKESVVVA